MKTTDQDLKVGDRVYFDIEGSTVSPYGQGVVSRTIPGGGFMVEPDAAIPAFHLKMVNIRKCEK